LSGIKWALPSFSLDQVKDKFIGEPGTPDRIEHEAKVEQSKKIKGALARFFPDGNILWASGHRYTFDQVADAIVEVLASEQTKKIEQ
jgi:hypothetical protein